ncbi:MAG: DoxX family protein [Pseudomonadota bacterium]
MRLKNFARIALGIFFIAAGLNHFINPAFYLAIMPPWLPWHEALVAASGVAEMAFGAMVLVRRFALLGGWGLIALCIAVFPANLHMALNPSLFPQFPSIALWLRLPLQIVAIAWIWWCTHNVPSNPPTPSAGARP